ncbi:MAG TPA: DNA alkylation repair protein, partial [Bacteroidota bacterium]|nr:DNA alkylation repair protein [Bacteroidota bacterium]
MNLPEVLTELKALANPAVARRMERFGLPSEGSLGISAPHLHALAKKIGTDQNLSLQLWKTGIRDAQTLAALIGDPALVTDSQMERWIKDVDSWGTCDACCGCLFVYSPLALKKAFQWCEDEREFVKRAGFVLMAEAAIHRKELADSAFRPMLRAIRKGSTDERNFVRKAVNWALRQIGKRNLRLNKLAIAEGEKIRNIDSRAARWIAADALRELRSVQVQRRLQKWEQKSR